MAPPRSPLRLLFLALLALLGLPLRRSAQSGCATRTFSSNRRYALCDDLPVLGSSLHWTHDTASSTLRLAFSAASSRSGGWVCWGINPSRRAMLGTQALLAYRKADGSVDVGTYDIKSYAIGGKSNISYAVADLAAEYGSDGRITIYGTVKLPKGATEVNQVWQVGPVTNGVPDKHDMSSANMASVGTLDLVAGATTSGGGGSPRLRKKNTHGVLNAVSWGVLLPMGAVAARYLKTFWSADPAWFYLHVSCQLAGYIVGVAGWGTGLKLGSESKGVQYTTHRSIGIALFCLGTLQVLALFLRPGTDHKYRVYWNAYHHAVGYVVITLGIVNVFKGFSILNPAEKWKTVYIVVIAALGAVAVLLEVVTWVIWLRRKSSDKGGKLNPSAANGHRGGDSAPP